MTARVLIVDDAAVVRMYHREILEAAGFEVFEAMNGLEGLEKAAACTPDLLLVDINMPKMDGYTLLKCFRADQTLRNVPAIMISTESETKDIAAAFASGANTYVVKPILPDVLKEMARLMTGICVS